MNHSPAEAGAGGAGGSRVLSLGSSRIGTCAFFRATSHMEAATARSGEISPRKCHFAFGLCKGTVPFCPSEADGDVWGGLGAVWGVVYFGDTGLDCPSQAALLSLINPSWGLSSCISPAESALALHCLSDNRAVTSNFCFL